MPKEQTTTLPKPLTERVHRLSDEALQVVLEAYREGRQAGEARLSAELAAYLEGLCAEFETAFGRVDANGVGRFEAGFAGAKPSPLVAAHFGGVGDVLLRVRGRLEELSKEGA